MFNSILFENSSSLSIVNVGICLGVSILLGIVVAITHYKTTEKTNKKFLISLIILPALVQFIIMLVNGNLGTSVAVMGAFGLVRFRSMQGNSREIVSIFWVMTIGLATGMGFVAVAIVITLCIALLMFILKNVKFCEKNEKERSLKVLIPENMDYTEVFDDIFSKYTSKIEMEKAKTTNMGTMYELTYNVILKNGKNEKEFIDELRCRNGNLNISLARPIYAENEL